MKWVANNIGDPLLCFHSACYAREKYSNTRVFRGTPAASDTEAISIKLIAVDPYSLSASQTFGLRVGSIKYPPVVGSPIAD